MLAGFGLAVLIGASLGFFGGGGSILTVPLLLYAFGLGPKEAIASSLIVVAVASTMGVLQHGRAGHVRLGVAVRFGSAGMLGAYGGGRASELLDGGVLLLLFAAMMILTSVAMWRGRRSPVDAIAPGSHAGLNLFLQGLAVGGFTGLVGAGGGFLIVPALVLWAGLTMPAAVATSLAIIVLNSLAAFAGYAAHVSVDYGLVGWVSVSAIAGSFLGTALARRIRPESLRRAFAGFVLVMGASILLREANLVVETAGPALPETIPQLALVVVVLALGVMAGRASRKPLEQKLESVAFVEGEGI
jgi:uncharacterized protein